MALRTLVVEGYRGILAARVSFDTMTVLFGENDCGKSSLLEALALVLAPDGAARPRVEPWMFHRRVRSAGAAAAGERVPLRIELTFGESRAGSWDRPELVALASVLGRRSARPRTLVVELRAAPAGEGSVEARWEIRSPEGRPSRDDPAALAAVRRLNPLVWLRGGVPVAPPAAPAPGTPGGAPVAAPDGTAELLGAYERFQRGGAPLEEREIEAAYRAAERLLAEWAPDARAGGPEVRAVVREILGHGVGAAAGVATAASPGGARGSAGPRRAGSAAQKLGVFLLTAQLFQHLERTAAPGVRPILVVEDPEAHLHPMTLAATWSLLERMGTQKIVTTQSGALLAVAPLQSLRRLVRGADGTVREWRVRRGALGKDDLRKVGYHLRARRGSAMFARAWLLVEGETEFWVLPDLARLCGYDLVQEGVAVVEFAQCGLAPLVRLARNLGIEWHVVVDGDKAGESYARTAQGLLGRGEPAGRRIRMLAERDIEHCFWRHGYAPVFERLAGGRTRASGAPPSRIIQKAIERHSKPGVAFELLAAVGERGPAGPPPPLRHTIEAVVALART